MFTCPHCHQRAMGAWAKMNVSVLPGRDCDACGKRMYAHWLSPAYIGLLSFVAGYFANRTPSLAWALGVLLLGAPIMFLLQIYTVPLTRRDQQAKGKTCPKAPLDPKAPLFNAN